MRSFGFHNPLLSFLRSTLPKGKMHKIFMLRACGFEQGSGSDLMEKLDSIQLEK